MVDPRLKNKALTSVPNPELRFASVPNWLASKAFSLICGSAFGVTAQNDVHGAAPDAFMALPPYTRTREGHVHQLGSGPKPCRLGLGVRKGSLMEFYGSPHET